MNKLIFIAVCTLLFSCKKEQRKPKPANFIEKEILLKDYYSKEKNKYFAKINLFIPVEFDTLQIWIDDSDCTGCETYKYRLTNAKSCLIQESGMFKFKYCNDSINRLTIESSAVGLEMNIDSTTLKNLKTNVSYRQNMYCSSELKSYTSNIENINGRDFIIMRYSGCDYFSKHQDIETLYAITSFAKTGIAFRCECKQKDCSNFDVKAREIIQSILIDTVSIYTKLDNN